MEKDGLHSVNTGAKFQSFIERSLKEMGYKSITKKEFDSSTHTLMIRYTQKIT